MKIRMVICWALLGIMVGLIALVISPLRGLLRIPGDLSNYLVHLGVLGLFLVILALTTRMNRVLRCFLILAGASALGWPISTYIHDLLFPIYPTEPITFILVFFVLPVTFLIGVFGAVVIGIRQFVRG